MNESPDELRQRIETLEDRISTACAAILRVSASLDLETVLREIVDSARALTGSRYGLIATVDDAGQPQDVVSTGLTPGELVAGVSRTLPRVVQPLERLRPGRRNRPRQPCAASTRPA